MTNIDSPAIANIIILDKHPVTRRGLAVLLKETFHETQLIETANVEQLCASSETIHPFLFIVVITSDFDEDGTNPVVEIRVHYPKAFIILYGDQVKPELVISYFKAGVRAYLSKHKDLTELISCITSVAAGKRYLNAGHKDFLFEYLIENYKTSKKQDLLTPRQNEVAQYLIEGLSTSAIAEKTGLHISTISTFKTAIFTKLGIDNTLKLKDVLGSAES